MRAVGFCLSILAALPVLAAPPTLKLPQEVRGEAGTFVAIRAESDSPWVSFRADAGLAAFPSDLLSDRKATVVTAARDGRYKVFAYTGNADGGADAIVWVIVGTPPVVVTPPGPGPGPGPGPPTPPDPNKATAATYVYEKDQTAIPSQVESALNRINRERNILATKFEQNTVDGSGEVPSQYTVALAAAKAAGLPALVVTAGATVLRVVKDPKTEQQVLEAVGMVAPQASVAPQPQRSTWNQYQPYVRGFSRGR